MSELYLGCDLYRAFVERLVPVAGMGNVDQIEAVPGPLAKDRMWLADHLANLEPCPVTGKITDNEVKIALGQAGNIWPSRLSGMF